MSAGGRIYTLDSEASWLSVLGCGWGLRAEEVATECLMTGTKCITEAESAKAKELQASTLFGEVLYKGICNLAKPEMLDLSNQKTLRVIEIGAGLGKAAAQLFFQFPHVVRVLGVEFVASRAQIARDAFSKLADHARSVRVETKAGASRGYQFRTFTETIKKPKSDDKKGTSSPAVALAPCAALDEVVFSPSGAPTAVRTLELRQGSVFDLDPREIQLANVIMCNVEFSSPSSYNDVCQLFMQTSPGCKILMYENLRTIFTKQSMPSPFPFKEYTLEVPSSWCPSGWDFHGYTRL